MYISELVLVSPAIEWLEDIGKIWTNKRDILIEGKKHSFTSHHLESPI